MKRTYLLAGAVVLLSLVYMNLNARNAQRVIVFLTDQEPEAPAFFSEKKPEEQSIGSRLLAQILPQSSPTQTQTETQSQTQTQTQSQTPNGPNPNANTDSDANTNTNADRPNADALHWISCAAGLEIQNAGANPRATSGG